LLFFTHPVNFFSGGAIANCVFAKVHPIVANDFVAFYGAGFAIYTVTGFSIQTNCFVGFQAFKMSFAMGGFPDNFFVNFHLAVIVVTYKVLCHCIILKHLTAGCGDIS
jgi:hypothetical protein